MMLVCRWILCLVMGALLLMGVLLAIVSAALHFADLAVGSAKALGYAEAVLLGVPALLAAIYVTCQLAVRLFAREL
jgi:hypothetical protein